MFLLIRTCVFWKRLHVLHSSLTAVSWNYSNRLQIILRTIAIWHRTFVKCTIMPGCGFQSRMALSASSAICVNVSMNSGD
jgi:hypothetical protein